MNPNWLGLLSAVFAFLGFFGAYHFSKELPLSRRLVFSGGFAGCDSRCEFRNLLCPSLFGAELVLSVFEVLPEPSF